MFYSTMMMHKPEDEPINPDKFRDILILEKCASHFIVGNYHGKKYHDKSNGRVILDVEMWCDFPTRETVNKVYKI
jgi:hypothetical protein